MSLQSELFGLRPPGPSTAPDGARSEGLARRRPIVGWLRNPAFDLTFVLGFLVVALAAGFLAVQKPALFPLLLFADLVFLGYHHVVSTFTRIAFDAKSFREHRFLVVALPLPVAIAAVLVVATVGVWPLMSLYLYWQWFHYTRQSFGIAKMYLRKSVPGTSATSPAREILTDGVIYGFATWGILRRSYQHPGSFLGNPLKVVPVSHPIVVAAGIVSVVFLVAWLGYQIRAAIRGDLALPHALYVLSHVAIFSTAYLFIDGIDQGWFTINVWHNAQYIAVVWLSNNDRFRRGPEAGSWFLSTISQTRHVALYLAVCLLITAVFYGLLRCLTVALAPLMATSLSLATIPFQIVNFHHYIVDAVIWKKRKRPLPTMLAPAG
jgi:hypothetical protein